MKSTEKSLAMWSLRMANHAMKGLVARSHLIKGLNVREVNLRSLLMSDLAMRRLTKRNLIGKGNIERNLTTVSLTTTIAMRRWKTARRSTLSSLGKLRVKI
jgi:hypothetical protein